MEKSKNQYPFFIFKAATKIFELRTDLVLQVANVFVTHFKLLNFLGQLNVFLLIRMLCCLAFL